jgi:hypothetical protein
MFLLMLTLYTCTFYLCVALPIVIAELVISYRSGGFVISSFGRSAVPVFAGFWGIVWLVSFVLAFRMVFPCVGEDRRLGRSNSKSRCSYRL